MSKKQLQNELIDAMERGKAFNGTPAEIHELYMKSHQYISMSSGISRNDDTTTWNLIQQHFHLCLITSHDNEATLMLDRMKDRFGAEAPKVVICTAQLLEATKGIEESSKYLKARDEKNIVCYKPLFDTSLKSTNTKILNQTVGS